MEEIKVDNSCLHKITCGKKMIGFTMDIAEEGKYSGSNFDFLVDSFEKAEDENVRDACFGIFGLFIDKPVVPFEGDTGEIMYAENKFSAMRKTIIYKGNTIGHIDKLQNGRFAHPYRFLEFDTLEEAGEDYVQLHNLIPHLFSA